MQLIVCQLINGVKKETNIIFVSSSGLISSRFIEDLKRLVGF